MTTNELAKLIVERVIRVQKLSPTPRQAAAAAQKLAVWIHSQPQGFTAFPSEEQAASLLRAEMSKVWELVVMSDLVRLTHYDEDCGPSEIIRERWYVVAADETGRRFAQGILFESLAEAEERALQMTRDGGVDPIASNWHEMSPVYGSEAYVSQGTEAELLAMERREEGL